MKPFTREFEIIRLLSENDENDTIRVVEWEMRFIRDTYVGISQGVTLLDLPTGNPIPAAQVTPNMIEGWVLGKEGNQAFIDMLQESHGPEADFHDVASQLKVIYQRPVQTPASGPVDVL